MHVSPDRPSPRRIDTPPIQFTKAELEACKVLLFSPPLVLRALGLEEEIQPPKTGTWGIVGVGTGECKGGGEEEGMR